MSGPWQPPVPSLASLPVDRTKTEPKPAYYKLQFGDEVTGFAYYVRTLSVVIGRNCERPASVPPPAITSPSVPPIPPLEVSLDQLPSPRISPNQNSILNTPPVADFPTPPLVFPSLPDEEPAFTEGKPNGQESVAMERGDGTDLGEGQKEEERREEIVLPVFEASPEGPTMEQNDVKLEIDQSGDVDMEDVKPDIDGNLVSIPPPPPPPTKVSAPLDHVDVDLGFLKSVSRNHAKICFQQDVGQFCLEIYGRNGAWVDDRYYVKGTIVPLTQGSQIQIATRIFSFVLPPSPNSSPDLNHYHLENASSMEDLPYPYNLPAAQVGYQEFYGEGGPGPATAANIAARVPVFNAFAAADGHGLGIEGVYEYDDGYGEMWDSDEDSEGDSDVESYDSAAEDRRRQMIRARARQVDDDSELSSLSSSGEEESEESEEEEDFGEEEEEEEDDEEEVFVPPKKNKKQAVPIGRRQSATEVEEPRPAGKAPGKGAGKDPVKARPIIILKTKQDMGKKKPKAKVEEVDEEESLPDVEPPSPPKNKKVKGKKAKEEEEKVKKEKKKKTIAPAPEVVPPPPPRPPSPIMVPTLAAALAQAPPVPPLPATLSDVKPMIQPQAQPHPIQTQNHGPLMQHGPHPNPLQHGPPSIPRALSMTQAPMLPRKEGSIPPTPGSQMSAPSPSASLSKEQQPFQHLTELIDTPGRPGHIIVNVPIPPSGAGPRPPPQPMVGLDGKAFIGPDPLKPTATFATIIHRALLYLPRGRGTLGEVCNWVAGEWEWFRLNPEAGWQNSIRHNLSLHKAFLKVPRIPTDDPESKGSVWIIDPEEGPLFEEKQRRDAQKSEGKVKNAEVKKERERQKLEERVKKHKDTPDMPVIGLRPAPVGHMGVPRQMALPPRPMPRPIPQPTAPSIQSANHKGALAPKTKITVVIQPITPQMRAKSVIATTDAAGAPLPFVCDGATLVLEQTMFHHLTADITDKLQLLGAAGAVDVLSAWVVNKNRTQSAKAAQAKAAATAANGKPGVIPNRPGVNQSVRPPVPAKPIVRPPPVNGAAKPPPPKALPGPAPPGANLTKVIGMIAEVANARGDVNIVGPNASALLRYIRVVGVDIDLRVAEGVWATGIVPPLPAKGPPKPVTNQNGSNVVKPGLPVRPNGVVPKPVPGVAPKPASIGGTTPMPANALKRKLDTPTPTPTTTNPVRPLPAAVKPLPPPLAAPKPLAPAPQPKPPTIEPEAKKPRLEA